MFGKKKAEDISEESGNKLCKSDKKERTEDVNVKEEKNNVPTLLLSQVQEVVTLTPV